MKGDVANVTERVTHLRYNTAIIKKCPVERRLSMQERVTGNEYRTSIVCVDSYDSQIMSGRICNQFCDGIGFHSTIDFLERMEELLDSMRCPQPFMRARSISEPPSRPVPSPIDVRTQEGTCATFAIRIMFRQNASWQGTVSWLEGERTENFRSALELLLLMDGVLTACTKELEPANVI